ncbi:MAG: aromatic-ring-hydroxylating dioxygenase subunit beta [Armatimonadota bacterium]
MPVSPQVREEILEFLYQEAECLDTGRFEDWLGMMTDDVQYQMPVRLTRERGDAPDRSDQMQFFWDDRATLELRVRRLRTDFAWAEDPPSRTRHFVSNVRIAQAPTPDLLDVRSYVLITRSRGDAPNYEMISGERKDVLRRADGTWKLARREFVVDQAMLGVKNLGIFV